jgi:hypothetical protein
VIVEGDVAVSRTSVDVAIPLHSTGPVWRPAERLLYDEWPIRTDFARASHFSSREYGYVSVISCASWCNRCAIDTTMIPRKIA